MERHRQLTDARESESNQLQHLQCSDLRRLGRAHLRLLERQIVATIDTLIEKELETQHQGAAAALRAVPGIGLQSAALLLAELPELGQSEQRRDRALAAVAPFNHDSGPLARHPPHPRRAWPSATRPLDGDLGGGATSSGPAASFTNACAATGSQPKSLSSPRWKLLLILNAILRPIYQPLAQLT